MPAADVCRSPAYVAWLGQFSSFTEQGILVTSTEPAEKVASLKLLAAQAAQQLPRQQVAELPVELIEFFQAVKFANETAEYHQTETVRLDVMASQLVTSWMDAPDAGGADYVQQQQQIADAAIVELQAILDHIVEQNAWITAHGGSLYANLHEIYAGMIAVLQGQISTISNVMAFLSQ